MTLNMGEKRMAKVYMLCGKLGSGKTWYANRLRDEVGAVVLSCDEIMFALFDGDLGDKHDEMAERIKQYFFIKSLEIVRAGSNVVLEWGFWAAAWRREARTFYEKHGVSCEMHYIDVERDAWLRQIERRNEAVRNGLADTYIVDDGLMRKLEGLFEEPEQEEIDVYYLNRYNA